MKVQVDLPGPLTDYAEGRRSVGLEVQGTTVHDAFSALWAACPRLRDRILDEQGRLRRHVNVFVDDESVRHTGGLATPLKDGATLSVIPAISGGST